MTVDIVLMATTDDAVAPYCGAEFAKDEELPDTIEVHEDMPSRQNVDNDWKMRVEEWISKAESLHTNLLKRVEMRLLEEWSELSQLRRRGRSRSPCRHSCPELSANIKMIDCGQGRDRFEVEQAIPGFLATVPDAEIHVSPEILMTSQQTPIPTTPVNRKRSSLSVPKDEEYQEEVDDTDMIMHSRRSSSSLMVPGSEKCQEGVAEADMIHTQSAPNSEKSISALTRRQSVSFKRKGQGDSEPIGSDAPFDFAKSAPCFSTAKAVVAFKRKQTSALDIAPPPSNDGITKMGLSMLNTMINTPRGMLSGAIDAIVPSSCTTTPVASDAHEEAQEDSNVHMIPGWSAVCAGNRLRKLQNLQDEHAENLQDSPKGERQLYRERLSNCSHHWFQRVNYQLWSEFWGADILPVMRKTPLNQFMHSKARYLMTITCTLANFFCACVELDEKLNHFIFGTAELENRWDRPWFKVELVCVGFFSFEIISRIIIEGRLHYSLPWWKWNLFDEITLAGGIVYVATDAFPNILVFRSFCSLSNLIVFESERLNQLMNTVVKMLHILLASIPAMISVIGFMMFVMLLFSIILVHGICYEIEAGTSLKPEDRALLEFYFGSFPKTVCSVFAAISGGDDWYLIMQPLGELSPRLATLLVIYIAMMLMGVLNILTGYFVEQAMQFLELSRDERMKAQLQLEGSYAKELREIFEKGDTDGSGTLSWAEFENHLTDERVTTYLTTMDLDVSELQTLFQILDTQQAGDVHIEDFVWGCMRLKGGAKSIDLCTLLFEHRQHTSGVDDQLKTILELLTPMVLNAQEGGVLE